MLFLISIRESFIPCRVELSVPPNALGKDGGTILTARSMIFLDLISIFSRQTIWSKWAEDTSERGMKILSGPSLPAGKEPP